MAKKKFQKDSIITEIINGTEQFGKLIQDHLSREKKNDHHFIKAFQNQLCDFLNNHTNYTWTTEQKPKYRTEGDSIDILGVCPGFPDYIIEIDATRGDQVAKKLFSRIALWGIVKDSTVKYVALLYPNTQAGGKAESEKFVRFGNSVLKRLNSKSSCVGIYHDGIDTELWDFNQQSVFVITNEYGYEECVQSMTQCAMAVIKNYIARNNITDYSGVQKAFKKFVDDKKGPSRYKYLRTIGGKKIHVYTQWREYGNGANWIKFVNLCKAKGYSIQKIWK